LEWCSSHPGHPVGHSARDRLGCCVRLLHRPEIGQRGRRWCRTHILSLAVSSSVKTTSRTRSPKPSRSPASTRKRDRGFPRSRNSSSRCLVVRLRGDLTVVATRTACRGLSRAQGPRSIRSRIWRAVRPDRPGLISTRCLDLNGSVMPKRTPWSHSPWRVRTLAAFLATSSRCWAVTSNTWKSPSVPTWRGRPETSVVAGLRVGSGQARRGRRYYSRRGRRRRAPGSCTGGPSVSEPPGPLSRS